MLNNSLNYWTVTKFGNFFDNIKSSFFLNMLRQQSFIYFPVVIWTDWLLLSSENTAHGLADSIN